MIIDVHTHIFPDEIRNKREKFFEGEKEFFSIYSNPNAKMVSYEELLELMDEEGIDKSVVFGFPWNNIEYARINNNYIITAVNKYPDRFIGFCCLNPLTEGADEEIKRCFDEGLKGVGEIAFYLNDIDEFIINKLEPIMKLCEEYQFPFMLHTNEPVGHIYPGKVDIKLKNIYNFIKKYPNNKIILAHMGGGLFFFYLLKKEVKEVFKNVYFDTAAVPYLYDNIVYKFACDIIGEDKILFGSDYPLIKPSRYFNDINSFLDKERVEKILGENFRNILEI